MIALEDVYVQWQGRKQLTLSQLTCLYQLAFVMGWSVMCGFLGSYLELRLGSLVEAMGDFSETNSGLTARSPETAWEEGMMVVR
jgi:hypothetical protein